ncbi:amidase [Cognatilysobacter tabacisoli]|uniref:amidase n=1 Tax=Cognatilysobacter tabacisoli TaxID=2315424 RepID=UPI000E6B480E|nr:amidase [Lysobacter tabacisoli]
MHAATVRPPIVRPRAAAFATAIALALSACASLPPGARSPAPAAAAADSAGIVETDIATLAARMERGETTSARLTAAYLRRIAAIDDGGPRLNAVIEVNPDAAEEAAARDDERQAGRVRGPLHGIPVLIKDNIDATPMVNSAGSLALASHRPASDAPLVTALREAGAVILGKTNLSEWANFRSTRSTSGWSARGGQTRNPYVLDRSPCGSSSGTGAAIAASLAAVGVGTETDGSILCPAAVNGLVGLKPTVGLVGRSGIIPISYSQDTAGPMARTVADAAALLAVLADTNDAADPAAREARKRAPVDYLAALQPDALKGARIGVLKRSGVDPQPGVDAAFERAVATLREAGATVVEVTIPTAGRWSADEFTVLLYEFKHGLNKYLRGSQAPVGSLEALIAYNRDNAAAQMPWFGQELFEQAQAKGALTDAAYRKAQRRARQLAGPDGIDAALRRQRLDALVAPTTGPAWPIDPVNGDNFTGASYGAAAVAGYPSLTVPMGDASGLPLGLAFLGAKWSEAKLLGYGFAFEQRRRARVAPTYLPTIDLAPGPREAK